MSKKRKTRQQKETASVRHLEQLSHIHAESPIYTVAPIKSHKPKAPLALSVNTLDLNYLRHDFSLILAASGIVVAFEVLLFALLTTNVIHLNFLGY